MAPVNRMSRSVSGVTRLGTGRLPAGAPIVRPHKHGGEPSPPGQSQSDIMPGKNRVEHLPWPTSCTWVCILQLLLQNIGVAGSPGENPGVILFLAGQPPGDISCCSPQWVNLADTNMTEFQRALGLMLPNPRPDFTATVSQKQV